MKPCPIGAESACCKHCFMGPCRLNARDPYSRVGVCGATIDTIGARNFARMVASGGAAHTDHGMGMLDVFREVVNGKIKGFRIKDETKLRNVAASIGIAVEGRETKAIAKLAGERSIPVYSFKSQVGHCLGAAGILEATAGLVAMQKGVIPATINFSEPRPGCTLDYVKICIGRPGHQSQQRIWTTRNSTTQDFIAI